MRLIDADALKERLFGYYECVNPNTAKETYRGETLMAYEVADMIDDCVDDAPTIEAEPVKHGRWKRTSDGAAFCTACKRKMNPSQYGYGYCGLCGARMDLEEQQ